MNSDDFYIGWQSQSPRAIGSHVRRWTFIISASVVAFALLLALAQRTIGKATFEWGTIQSFTGTLKLTPYPHLLVPRAGHPDGFSDYYLVAPFKFGLDRTKLASLDGKPVTLQGTLIYRDDQTMVEARPDSIEALSGNAFSNTQSSQIINPKSEIINPPVTVRGEIVDSKCYLGVMNPGRLAPHRACAVRCISGGVPPILLVQPANAPPIYYLLVSADGHPVNQQILDMVATPIEITGFVEQDGNLKILRADPSTYRPL
jgi:hypothetical protein